MEAFQHASDALLSKAKSMSQRELLERIEALEDELSFIASLLDFYGDESHELYRQNLAQGKFLILERNLYVSVFNERVEEFSLEDQAEYECYA